MPEQPEKPQKPSKLALDKKERLKRSLRQNLKRRKLKIEPEKK